MARNSVPRLLDSLLPSRQEVADWAGVSYGLTGFWLAGKYEPKPPDRARLVKAVRKRAGLLLKLADAVEREGKERAAAVRRRRSLLTKEG